MPRWIKRQWFQARLRTLFAITIGAALLTVVITVPLRAVEERAATRQWIAQKRGQVIYYQGAWELQNKRGRVEPGQNQLTIPLGRRLLGDEKAVLIARAATHGDPNKFVAGDIGPSGLVLEPMGEATFERVYELFLEQAKALAKAGPDLIVIETIMDIRELKAANIATREVYEGPIFARMFYEEVAMTMKSTDPPTHPGLMWLFRRTSLDEWAERGKVPIVELVTHVVIHELAHHFGWSDEDIAAIDPWWE